MSERILAYELSEIFLPDDLKQISGGFKVGGTRSVYVEYTHHNGKEDVQGDVNLDW